jgi:transcriptional regulator with XRE-family HTH domain
MSSDTPKRFRVRIKLSDEAVAKIHLLRAEGLLQREIAAMVGCSRPHVGRILRGLKRAPFNPKKQVDLGEPWARLLKCPPPRPNALGYE